MVYDLGTTMTAAFQKGKLNFELLRGIIRGYNDYRKPTEWERNHLYEALCYGILKFVIWGIEDIEYWGWENIRIDELEDLTNYNKERFYENLKS